MAPHNSTFSNANNHFVVSLLGFGLTAVFASITLHEWFVIGVLAEPEVIDAYHFGSEAMVGNGGQMYQSAGAYAGTALVEGLFASILLVVFLIGARRRSSALIIFGYVALALAAAFFGQVRDFVASWWLS